MPPTPDPSQQQADALHRYFGDCASVVRPWSLGQAQLTAPLDPKMAMASLKQARQRMLDMADDAGKHFTRYLEADGHLVNALRAESLIDAGFHLGRINDYGLPDAGREGVRLLRDQQTVAMADAIKYIERYEEVARLRMGGAMRLLRLRFVSDNLTDGSPTLVVTRSVQLVQALYLIAKSGGTYRALRDAFTCAHVLLVNLKGNENLPRLVRQTRSWLSQMRDRAIELWTELGEAPFPFQHERGTISIGQSLCEKMPAEDDFEGLMRETGAMLDRYAQLYQRVLGNLAGVSEQVEVITGVAPRRLRRKG